MLSTKDAILRSHFVLPFIRLDYVILRPAIIYGIGDKSGLSKLNPFTMKGLSNKILLLLCQALIYTPSF